MKQRSAPAMGEGGNVPWMSKFKFVRGQNHQPVPVPLAETSTKSPQSVTFPPLPPEPQSHLPNVNGNGIEEEEDLSAEEESEYEEIDHLPQYANENGIVTRPAGVKWVCSLCGSCNPAVRCQMCNNQLFCGSCNEMYHRHPQRHCHVRKLLDVVHSRPPLPPKVFHQPPLPPVPAHAGRHADPRSISRSPSPHHFSTQYLNEQGLPIAPPRRNRKFGSTSNLRSANNSPTTTRKLSFSFDPFGSLKRMVKGKGGGDASAKSTQAPVPVKPVPINKIAEIPTLHNAWRQEVNAKRQQKQFQQILSNAARATSLQRLNEADEFAPSVHRPSIPTTVLELGNRGNSRSFVNLNDQHHMGSNMDGGHRHWEDEDNEVRHINRNMTMDDHARPRPQFNDFQSTSATNLHRITSANSASHFGTLQRERPTRHSITGPAPAPVSIKPPMRPPPSIPPKQFVDSRPQYQQQQNFQYQQEQMFQSAHELNRAGAFVSWNRPSGFQEFHEQQMIGQPQQPHLQQQWQNEVPAEIRNRQESFEQSLADFDGRRGSEPVFYPQRQEQFYGNDPQQPVDEKSCVTRTPGRSGSRAQSQVPVSQSKPQQMSKPMSPAPPKGNLRSVQSSPTPNKQHQQKSQQMAEPETVTTTFKITESPEGPWSCEHCTYVNHKSTKVCTICCKTPLEGYRTICISTSSRNSNKPPVVNSSEKSAVQDNARADKPKKKLGRSPPPPPVQTSSSESESGEEESESEASSSGNEDVITQIRKVSPPKVVSKNKTAYVRQSSRELKTKKTTTETSGPSKAGGVNKNQAVNRKVADADQEIASKRQNTHAKASNLKKASGAIKSSKGTSPPPQEISTQTYEAAPPLSPKQASAKPVPKSSYNSDAATQSTTSSGRDESPPPQARIAMSEKAMRYARRAQQQSKLKRSASAHLTSTEFDEPWAFNEFHHHPNYHRRFHNQGQRAQEYEGRQMYRSSSRHSLASDTRSLPVSGPPSRDVSPPGRGRYYDDFRDSGMLPPPMSLKASWDRFPSPGDYFASIEDLVSRKRHESIKSQEFELSRLLKEAEDLNYSPEDVQVALKMCGDRNPVKWLQENWSSMIETVQTLATKYGREKGQEQNDVGTISSAEAKEALRHHRGNVWAAVTECVEQRRRKYSELQSRGTFLREDILTALTAHHGNLDAAYVELSKAQLKPFLMRIWGPPSGPDNEASASRTDSVLSLLSLASLEQQAQIQKIAPAAGDLMKQPSQTTAVVVKQDNQPEAHNKMVAQVQGRENELVTQTESQSKVSTGGGLQTAATFNEKVSINTNIDEQAKANLQTTEISAESCNNTSLNVIMNGATDENHVKHDPEEEQFMDASSELNIITEDERKESLISNISSISTTSSTTSSSDPDLLLDESRISEFIQNFLVPPPPPHDDPIPAKETSTLPGAPCADLNALEGSHTNKQNETETTTLKVNEVEQALSPHSPQSSMSLPSPCCSSSLSFGDDACGTRTSSELEKLFDDSHQQMMSPQSQLENLAKAMNIITEKLGVLLVKQDAKENANMCVDVSILVPVKPEQILQRTEAQTQVIAVALPQVPAQQVQLEPISTEIPITSEALLICPPDEFNDTLPPSKSGKEVKKIKENPEPQTHSSMLCAVENHLLHNVGLNEFRTSELMAFKSLVLSDGANFNATQEDMESISRNSKGIAGDDLTSEIIANDPELTPKNSAVCGQLKEPIDREAQLAVFVELEGVKENVTPDEPSAPSESTDTSESGLRPLDDFALESEPEKQTPPRTKIIPHPTRSDDLSGTTLGGTQIRPVKVSNEEIAPTNEQIDDYLDEQDEPECDDLSEEDNNEEGIEEVDVELDFDDEELEEEGEHDEYIDSESGSLSLSDRESGEGGSESFGDDNDEGGGSDQSGDKEEDEDEIPVEVDEESEEEEVQEAGIGMNEDEEHENAGNANDGEENIYEEVQLNREIMNACEVPAQGTRRSGLKGSKKVKSLSVTLSPKPAQPLRIIKKIPHNAIAAIAQSLSSPTVATALTEISQTKTEIKISHFISTGKVRSVNQAQLALKLIDMNFNEEDSVAAATECSSLYTALCFLQQECLLCAGKFCAKQMISMLHCIHRCCRTCASEYFMVQIRDHPIIDLTCPFCKEPSNLNSDPEFTATTDYFSQLDIVLKDLLSERYHEMFQRKLRDWTLAKVPNFKWCSKCSSGFIMEPMQTRLVCPDCGAVTCAICMEEWDKDNHDHKDRRRGESLDLCDENDPESSPPLKSVVAFLNENCIQCPSCKQRFTLARGGCMHLTCTQCRFEFCSGCSSQFRMGSKCSENAFCQKLGLHAHHPRNCLFYLRDKEPDMLRRLLDENKIPYNKEDAANIATPIRKQFNCQVPIQKETESGAEDDLCGQEASPGHTTVCLVHYVEYLGLLIWQNGLDPISLLNNDDLETIIKRAHKRLPRKPQGMTETEYRPLLLKVIENEIPL